MEIYFSFLDEYRHQRTCTVNATAPAGTDPHFMSFYKVKCRENEWSTSWGYDESSGAAVMTLLKYVPDWLGGLDSTDGVLAARDATAGHGSGGMR